MRIDPKPTPRSVRRGRTPSGRPNPVDIHVGERLRLRRTSLGFSQEALATRLGLTFQQIQKYENGDNRISASRLFDLACALEVSIDYFYDEMSEGVMAASPRHMAAAAADPEIPPPNPVNSRETLDLIRTYYRIADPAVRRRVHELAQALEDTRTAAVSPDSDEDR